MVSVYAGVMCANARGNSRTAGVRQDKFFSHNEPVCESERQTELTSNNKSESNGSTSCDTPPEG